MALARLSNNTLFERHVGSRWEAVGAWRPGNQGWELTIDKLRNGVLAISNSRMDEHLRAGGEISAERH